MRETINVDKSGTAKFGGLESLQQNGFKLIGFAMQKEKDYCLVDEKGDVLWSNKSVQVYQPSAQDAPRISLDPIKDDLSPKMASAPRFENSIVNNVNEDQIEGHSSVRAYVLFAVMLAMSYGVYHLNEEVGISHAEIESLHADIIAGKEKEQRRVADFRARVLFESEFLPAERLVLKKLFHHGKTKAGQG